MLMMMNPMIMEEKNDLPPASGYAPPAPPAPPTQGTPPAPPTQETGGQFDEWGYAIQPPTGQPPAPPAPPTQVPAQVNPPAPPAPPAAAAPVTPEPPVTGYGAPPVAPVPPAPPAPPAAAAPVPPTPGTPPVTPPAAPPAADTPPVFTDEDFVGVGDNDKTQLKRIATEKKWSKEFLKDVVDLRKLDYAEAMKVRTNQNNERQQKLTELRTNYYNELMSDPTYGGANFQTTIHKVDKVLAEHLPTMKKNLTETKGILPPNVMRELAKMAEKIYGTESFEQGGGQVKETDPNDHLNFYTN
jgi:hypothetical protein